MFGHENNGALASESESSLVVHGKFVLENQRIMVESRTRLFFVNEPRHEKCRQECQSGH